MAPPYVFQAHPICPGVTDTRDQGPRFSRRLPLFVETLATTEGSTTHHGPSKPFILEPTLPRSRSAPSKTTTVHDNS